MCASFCLLAAAQILRRFKSLRTDYGKLKKLGKSGSGAKKLTSLQRWKLARFSFLEGHITPRSYAQELGRVSMGINLAVKLFLTCNFFPLYLTAMVGVHASASINVITADRGGRRRRRRRRRMTRSHQPRRRQREGRGMSRPAEAVVQTAGPAQGHPPQSPPRNSGRICRNSWPRWCRTTGGRTGRQRPR